MTLRDKLEDIVLGDLNAPVTHKTKQGDIVFYPETHEYKRHGILYTSVSDVLKRYGLTANYTNVPASVLAKAAARGKAIHSALDAYIKDGVTGVGKNAHIDRVHQYFQTRMIDLTTAVSEQVYFDDNYLVAGTCDVQYRDGNDEVIADWKTTSQIHYDAVSWQLSVYAYLITGGDIIHYYCKKLKVFHIQRGKLDVKDIPLIDYDAVKGLLEANLNQAPSYSYVKDVTNILPPSDHALLVQVMHELALVNEQKKALEAERERISNRVRTSMIDHSENVIETDDIKITYVAPFSKQTWDSTKLEQLIVNNNLDVDDFKKKSITSDSLRITLKVNKDDDDDRLDNFIGV